MPSNHFLGQDLYRQALSCGDLSPFSEAAHAMAHAKNPRQGADIFKAVRFGMAGLIISGWQATITEPLPEPVAFGSGTLAHRLRPSAHFPQHDPTIIDRTSSYGQYAPK